VPLTSADYERIDEIDWAKENKKFEGKNLFRALKPSEKIKSPYTHAIKPGEDGHCPFLVDNLCFIHSSREAKTKPAICQLFPYCFNETPTGVYATVSFLSMGVIYNSGKALSEQHPYLKEKYAEFQRLFPNHHPNWSDLKLTVGQPISWDRYLAIEEKLLDLLKSSDSIESAFLAGSEYLVSLSRKNSANSPPAKNLVPHSSLSELNANALNHLDQVLIANLHRLYFPTSPMGHGQSDFRLARFLYEATLGHALGGAKVVVPTASYSLNELKEVIWPDKDGAIDDLIYRYFYSRIFAKLYFAAGFGQLSLISGFHHLGLVYSLIRWQAKALAKARGATAVSAIDVIAAVRQVEKRLGETVVGPYAAAIFELLFFSPSRLKRFLQNSAQSHP